MSAATLSGPNVSRSMTPAMRASRVLGWVSFAIGAAELLAPRKTARTIGLDEKHSGLLRAYGAREVLAGVGSHSVYPVPALWSRVAGDLLDLGTLAVAARREPDGARGRRVWIAMAAVAGIAIVDAMVASRMAAETKEGRNVGAPKDYSDRSGFPAGVEAARGTGIVQEVFAGRAGGAAAGDVSSAGEAQSGRASTDLADAPAETQRAAGSAPKEESVGNISAGTASGASGTSAAQSSTGGSLIGGGQTMSKEARKAVPEPPAYTAA